MLLIYDSKCQLCKNLAYKIHFSTDTAVEIQPLNSPAAHQSLKQFYPDGWTHDFYVVQNGRCKKGVWAVPTLARAVGARHMASLLAEYGYYRLSPKSCARVHQNGAGRTDGTQLSKRRFIKLAAMTPLLAGFSKVARAYPLSEAPAEGGFLVHVAEINTDQGDNFQVKTYRCTTCGRTPVKENGLSNGSTARLIEKSDLLNTRVKALATNGDEPLLKIQRVQYEKSSVNAGERLDTQMTVVASMLDHPNYNLSVSVGEGRATTLVGMAQHDLPLPALDFVVVHGETADAASYFAAYAQGVRGLAKLHASEGRPGLATIYREVESGLSELGGRYAEAVDVSVQPIRNEFVLTSMPEALRFFGLPSQIREQQQKAAAEASGCDCTCSCGVCCGCGCTLGLCVSPDPCFCDCCVGCGCGCGCCA